MKYIILVFAMFLCFSLMAVPKLVGTFAQAGFTDWDTTNESLNFTSINDTIWTKSLALPAGTYQYKILEGSSWSDPNYPSNNLEFTLAADSTVTWLCNTMSDVVMHTVPNVAANFIQDIGGTENWSPWDPFGDMVDPNHDYIYTWQHLIPEGTWEFKITMNDNWEVSTTTNNIAFVSDGITPTTITYNFILNTVTTSASAPPSASIKFIIDDTAGQTHTALYLKGSWSATGNYDTTWGNGMEHGTFHDDGLNGDAAANDHIFTMVQDLVSDAGSNTWQWGFADENHEWVAGNFEFFVANAEPQTLSYVILGGTTQDVTVTFQVNMAAVDPALYAGGVTVQGDVAPLDWTFGSHMMTDNGTLFTVDITFPTGSNRMVSYKYASADANNVFAWEVMNGNHTFAINDSFSTQVLPVTDFGVVANHDAVAPQVTVQANNYPNPFHTATTIEYQISKSGMTTLDIYNIRGQLVRSLVHEMKAGGDHRISWDGKDSFGKPVGSGLYFYKLRNNATLVGKKMILLK